MNKNELYVKALRCLSESISMQEREREFITQEDNDDDLIREAIENNSMLEMINKELSAIKVSTNPIKPNLHENYSTDRRITDYRNFFDSTRSEKRYANAR